MTGYYHWEKVNTTSSSLCESRVIKVDNGVILDVLFPWERNGWTKQNIIVCSSGVDSTTFTTQMSSQQVVQQLK